MTNLSAAALAERPWLAHYPAGVPAEVDWRAYPSLVAFIEESLEKHAARPAYDLMGKVISFADLDRLSRAFAAWLQSTGLERGARVAIMSPNLLHYPVAMIGALRAGMIVVNVNPLYTARELRHQLVDSGASAIVVLKTFLPVFEAAREGTQTRHVVVADLSEIPGFDRPQRVDGVAPGGPTPFAHALALGLEAPFVRPSQTLEDVAVLQYTGGTTGVSKGAALTHGNLVAALLAAENWAAPALRKRGGDAGAELNVVCALPLYHVFAFIACALMGLRLGGMNVLIPDPRDLAGAVAALKRRKPHFFPAVNTLFNGFLHGPGFAEVDFSELVLCNGGGSATLETVARKWLATTGAPIVEGYGLSETCAIGCCNFADDETFTGTIGVPLPSVEVRILDDDGAPTPVGEAGEIAIRGPQVMSGYWSRPDETRQAISPDGWFRTGDVGIMDETGRFRIVDRKKDMILVSGFNVYPNEIEAVVSEHPGVLECAVVGIADPKTGEAVLVYAVPRDDALTREELIAFCRERLTGYKAPKRIEFRKELPKTNVGKILRRQLRDEAAAAAG